MADEGTHFPVFMQKNHKIHKWKAFQGAAQQGESHKVRVLSKDSF
jgi:hypothetical protein